jgi:predicted nucleic acid-binding protein
VHDPDDDKFVDAAVAGEADWIVTEDSHCNVLFEDARLTVRPLHPLLFIERYL